MKLRLRNRHRTDTAYNVIDDKEQLVGIADEGFRGMYWLLTMRDNPQSMKFEKLSDLTKYVVKL